MRSVGETRARWDKTIVKHGGLEDLKASVKSTPKESPCTTGLRSICWKVFLFFKGLDQSSWIKSTDDSRSAYTSLKSHFLKNLENADDLSADDPLTDTETSPWNTLRHDEELRAEIYLDVGRCMPENLYFREPSTQTMLLDILFVYCKLNRDIGYRQGMHEVLAPVIWVVSRDGTDTRNQELKDHDHTMASMLDQDFVEHDAFTLFSAIMQTVKVSYEMGSNSGPLTSGVSSNSPIVERSKRIHENYLQHADPELAEHLTAIEILPQIFLIRWIRLLFGREFPFEDVLALWDVLFAEDPGLDLVDLISVSMLLRIRWQLLEADYSAALTLLLRYPVPPHPHGPTTFVGDAVYLRDNLQHDGGDHIISKYSNKAPETTVTRKLPKKLKRARTIEQEAAQNARAPKATPARIFQDQGGIEGIIHEAAKGVYSRGEKWGVGKALRGAMQGLQSGHSSPRRASDKSRWSLDNGRMISEKPADVVANIQALEQRNKSLAKLLEKAVDELWEQQKQIHEKDKDAAADALGLSIAKVQFVQVYLENSTIPLPSEASSSAVDPEAATSAAAEQSRSTLPRQKRFLATAQTDGSVDERSVENTNSAPDAQGPMQESLAVRKKSPPSTPKIGSQSKTSGSPPPRPSLDKSPFSWMLGEDMQKSGFVAASPFQPEKTGGRSGNLFGSPGNDSDGKNRMTSGRDGRGDSLGDDEGDDIFTMGSLKARKET